MTKDIHTIRALEEKMYGATKAEVLEAVESSITFRCAGAAMCVASLMSDAQEEIAHGMAEAARQTLNRAKLILSVHLMKD
jgi:hypothetical protein